MSSRLSRFSASLSPSRSISHPLSSLSLSTKCPRLSPLNFHQLLPPFSPSPLYIHKSVLTTHRSPFLPCIFSLSHQISARRKKPSCFFTPIQRKFNGMNLEESGMCRFNCMVVGVEDIDTSAGIHLGLPSCCLRTGLSNSTQLPGPNYHCHEGSKLAMLPPPESILEVL